MLDLLRNPMVVAPIFWLFWPGGMFFTAHFIEHRKVYLGKGQSRMFFPGDFMLGIAISNFLAMYSVEDFRGMTPKYWATTAIVHAIIALIMHIVDISRYPKWSKHTPTKLAHDFAGYFVSFWLIASLGLPKIRQAISSRSLGNHKANWYCLAGASLFFVCMTIYDLSHPATQKELLLMHPPYYGRQKERVIASDKA